MSWFKVFSGVVIGNIVSWAIIGVIGFFLSFAIMGAALEELIGGRPVFNAPSSPVQDPPKSSNVASSDYLAGKGKQEQQRVEQSRRQQASNRTDPSVIRTNRQMCEFWIEEFKKDGAEQSRKYRDAACSRYRASLN